MVYYDVPTGQWYMPNQPRPDNPARAVRIEDGLWHAAKRTAAERGETVSDVIRRALERYVKRAGADGPR